MTPAIRTCSIPRPSDFTQTSYPEFPSQIINFGLASSALFDTRHEDLIFKKEGEKAYMAYMRAHQDTPFMPGPILPFMKKMMGLNRPDHMLVNFSIISRNNPQVALRIHNSIHEHGLCLKIKNQPVRFGMGEAYIKGRSVTPMLLHNFGIDLFLTPNREDVMTALSAGIPSGQVYFSTQAPRPITDQNRILVAFDFDRVMGSARGLPQDRYKKDSEDYFRDEGLLKYWKREAQLATQPAHPGPLAPFFYQLVKLRAYLRENNYAQCLEIATVTARSSDPLARIQATLDHWGGEDCEEDYRISARCTPKGNHLQELGADIFFDDSEKHVMGAADQTASILVPHVKPGKPRAKVVGKLVKICPTTN